MATVIPAPKQFDMSNIMNLYQMKQQKQIFDKQMLFEEHKLAQQGALQGRELDISLKRMESTKAIADRRAEISEAYQQGLDKEIEFRTGEGARQARLARISGDTATAKRIEAENKAYNALSPQQKEDQLMAQAESVKNRTEVANARSAADAARAQASLIGTQLGMEREAYKRDQATIGDWSNIIEGPMGRVIGKDIASINKTLAMTQDPEERARLEKRLDVKTKEAMGMYSEQQKTSMAATKETQAGDYTSRAYSEMSPEVMVEAQQYYRANQEPADIRTMKSGRWPGGKPGASFIREPATKRQLMHTHNTAIKAGYSEKEWEEAESIDKGSGSAIDNMKNQASEMAIGKKKVLTVDVAQKFRDAAGGDVEKAKQMAIKAGYAWEE